MSAQQDGGGRRLRTPSKDSILWLVGLGLMIWQGFELGPDPFNLWAFLGGMVTAGVPGAVEAWRLMTGRAVGPQPPSPSPGVSSSPEPSSPSSGV